jgi:DNA-binding NarL/FixJ family response regulator
VQPFRRAGAQSLSRKITMPGIEVEVASRFVIRSHGPSRILVVKGDSVCGDALRGAVTQLLPGSEVDQASSLAEARAFCERGIVHELVVTGVHLPDGDALDWLTEILSQYPAVRIVVVTCRRETRMLMLLHQLGVHAVFDAAEGGLVAFQEALRVVILLE